MAHVDGIWVKRLLVQTPDSIPGCEHRWFRGSVGEGGLWSEGKAGGNIGATDTLLPLIIRAGDVIKRELCPASPFFFHLLAHTSSSV